MPQASNEEKIAQEKAEAQNRKFTTAATIMDSCWVATATFRGAPRDEDARARLAVEMYHSLIAKGGFDL